MLRANHGKIILDPDGTLHITGWSLTGDPGASRADIVVAVRARVNEIMGRYPGVPPLTTTMLVDDVQVPPVATAAEREAEMETYLLINRCQGNG